ncbi:hypothetical protein V2J09_010270, partial [Rumex salicifolius]
SSCRRTAPPLSRLPLSIKSLQWRLCLHLPAAKPARLKTTPPSRCALEDLHKSDATTPTQPISSSCEISDLEIVELEMKLLFSNDAPPLHVIAAAKVAGLPISFDGSLTPGSSPFLILPDGSKLAGTYVLLRYIGRAVCHLKLYGSGAYESGQIDQWLDYVPIFNQGSEFEAACDYVNDYLSTHTFLVGQDMSIADIALWSSLAVD